MIEFDRYKRMVRHKQDKYGVSTLKQRVMHGGVDHNIDNERKAKGMKEEFTTLPLHVEVPTNIKEFNLGLMFRESLDKIVECFSYLRKLLSNLSI